MVLPPRQHLHGGPSPGWRAPAASCVPCLGSRVSDLTVLCRQLQPPAAHGHPGRKCPRLLSACQAQDALRKGGEHVLAKSYLTRTFPASLWLDWRGWDPCPSGVSWQRVGLVEAAPFILNKSFTERQFCAALLFK